MAGRIRNALDKLFVASKVKPWFNKGFTVPEACCFITGYTSNECICSKLFTELRCDERFKEVLGVFIISESAQPSSRLKKIS